MKLYAISGLGADKRVFQYLKLDCDLVPLDWIDPIENETIEDYAKRFTELIDTSEEYGIVGVSFGGLVAVEMSIILNPKITILISSAETRLELRSIYRFLGKTKMLNLIPHKLFDPPRKIASWIFGAKNKKLLGQILDDTDLRFAKWAANELINWKSTERLRNVVMKIGGSKDKLIPPTKGKDLKLIENGEHFLIVDRADEVSHTINQVLINW